MSDVGLTVEQCLKLCFTGLGWKFETCLLILSYCVEPFVAGDEWYSSANFSIEIFYAKALLCKSFLGFVVIFVGFM